MADKKSFMRRWEDSKATKTQVLWACLGCVAATLVLGFTWGGWVTGSNASEMANKAAAKASTELAAAVCVNRFVNDPDATAKLAALKGAEYWKRNDFIEKGGWVMLPGVDKAVTGAAELCAQHLMDAKLPVLKAATSG